jgi:hypothetical protein
MEEKTPLTPLEQAVIDSGKTDEDDIVESTEPVDAREPVLVFTASSISEAEIIRAMLLDEGIDAELGTADDSQLLGESFLGAAGGAAVLVSAGDEARAEAVIADAMAGKQSEELEKNDTL